MAEDCLLAQLIEGLLWVVLDLDSQSERFRCFLRATRNAPGNWFYPVMQFTQKELDSATYYQLDCRKTLPESPRDYEWNESHVESLDLIKTDAGMEIQLPDQLAVSKVVLLKSNMVAGLGGAKHAPVGSQRRCS